MNPTAAFNPRGTSGSGKTTIVRAILDVTQASPIRHQGHKIRMYKGRFVDCDIYILGDYRGVCGGCDTIQPFIDILPMIEEVMASITPTLLVYEGLLISHSIGSIGNLVKPYGERHVMGFLDTPLEVCLDRVKNRRLERGQLAPLNPENTTKDHASVARCHARASQQGFHTVSINHENAIAQSLGILHGLSEIVLASTLDSGTGSNPHPKGCADASPAVD